MQRNRIAAAAAAVCAGLLAAPSGAQHGAPAGEWPSYGGDVGSTKYSPLDQIDAGNFGQLENVWRWRSVDGFLSKTESGGEWYANRDLIFDQLLDEDPLLWRAGRAPFIRNLKATPLMQDGLLLLNTPISMGAAVHPATGETVWAYNPKSYEKGTTTMTVVWNQRGVAYWTNGEEGDEADSRVYWGTGDGYLISVDARTGRPIEEFGDGGRVDLMEGLPRANRGERDYLNALLYSMQSPPVVVRDVVVTGASIADRRITKESIPGWVRGWDARTGELRWVFRTVPQEGDEGVETWGDESWRYSGNANVWTMLSGDDELGIVYLPIGTATNDFYGGHRPGDNLYSESLVAVDVATGEKVWHFQAVHHGLWDYDFPAAPTLIDLPGRDGAEPRKIVAQVSKQGFLYVFDRVTGKPVWPIEDRPVPSATMPGDTTAPTQPFPTKPAPFEYQGVTEDDLADFTPEIRQMALGGVISRLRDRAALHAAIAAGAGRQAGHDLPALGRRRRELVRRRGRPGDRLALRAVEERVQHGHLLHAGSAGGRHAPLHPRRPRAPARDAGGPAALQAAVHADDRDRSEHRRACVDEAARQQRPPAPAPAPPAPRPSAARRRHLHRAAADQDPADPRPARPRRRRRQPARGPGQANRRRDRRSAAARARARHADDVSL